jgi:hypothetical protein
VKYKKLLGALDLSFGKLPHLSRRDPTSFERRFLKEFEESFHVLVHVNSDLSSFESFLQTKRFERMDIIPQLHASVSHVEKLTDLLVLLSPMFPLTSRHNTRQPGIHRRIPELEIR